MFDLLETKITLNCPECDFENEVVLKQVSKEEEIICTGCLQTIKLKDNDKSTSAAAEGLKKSLDDLKKVF